MKILCMSIIKIVLSESLRTLAVCCSYILLFWGGEKDFTSSFLASLDWETLDFSRKFSIEINDLSEARATVIKGLI